MLTYRDCKDRERKLLMKKDDFDRYFEIHPVKEDKQ